MIRVMHEEHDFSDLFLKFLLARSMRQQAASTLHGGSLYRRFEALL